MFLFGRTEKIIGRNGKISNVCNLQTLKHSWDFIMDVERHDCKYGKIVKYIVLICAFCNAAFHKLYNMLYITHVTKKIEVLQTSKCESVGCKCLL